MSALCRLSSYISHLYGTGGKGFACIYPRFPQAREQIFRLCISLIGIPPPRGSPAAALIACDGCYPLGLWMDGSIIMFSAVIAFGMIAFIPSESWRLQKIESIEAFALVACPYGTQKKSKRIVGIRLLELRFSFIGFFVLYNTVTGDP